MSSLARALRIAIGTVVYAFDSVLGLVPAFNRRNRASGVVLLYHGVPAVDRQRFARQLSTLDRYGTVVPLERMLVPADGTWRFAITFDDALESFGRVGVDELAMRSWPSTVFVPSAQMGRAPAWENAETYGDDVLSAPELVELKKQHVEIGSHSRHHVRLPDLDRATIDDEVGGSRIELEREIGDPARYFAYPWGDWSDTVVDACRNAGYERTFTVSPEPVRDPDTYLVPRVTVHTSDSAWEFRLKALGAYRWVGTWMRLKRALRRDR